VTPLSGGLSAQFRRWTTAGVCGNGTGYAAVVERITVNPKQMGGVPCIRGLRIPVATVVGMIANGLTADEVVAELPPLVLEDVAAALRFAADVVADRQIPLRPTA
jgi:uncharacterized protein (DUF433 family)